VNKRTAYLAGLAAVVAGGALAGSAYMWRAYRRTRPVRFEFNGTTYVRLPDGRFTGAGGAPVLSPELEEVRAYWESKRSRR
jgi:hypothetical protein